MAGHTARHGEGQGRLRSLSMGAYAALAAGVLATAGLALAATAFVPREPIRLAPVVATLPERSPSALASSAMIGIFSRASGRQACLPNKPRYRLSSG